MKTHVQHKACQNFNYLITIDNKRFFRRIYRSIVKNTDTVLGGFRTTSLSTERQAKYQSRAKYSDLIYPVSLARHVHLISRSTAQRLKARQTDIAK